jgi:hypothetical protein
MFFNSFSGNPSIKKGVAFFIYETRRRVDCFVRQNGSNGTAVFPLRVMVKINQLLRMKTERKCQNRRVDIFYVGKQELKESNRKRKDSIRIRCIFCLLPALLRLHVNEHLI